MSVTITPMPQALGATVEGLEVGDQLDPPVVELLQQAWAENPVLFFPQLRLTDAQHITLGSAFGSLAATSQTDDDQRDQVTRGPDGEILVLDAATPQGRANAWHTDVTFTATPPIGSLLAMQTCPAKGATLSGRTSTLPTRRSRSRSVAWSMVSRPSTAALG